MRGLASRSHASWNISNVVFSMWVRAASSTASVKMLCSTSLLPNERMASACCQRSISSFER